MTKTCRRRWREHLPTIAQNYADAFEEFERVRKENVELRALVETLRRQARPPLLRANDDGSVSIIRCEKCEANEQERDE